MAESTRRPEGSGRSPKAGIAVTTKAIVASPPSPEPSRLPVLALATAWTMIAVSLLVYWRGWSHHVPIGYGADLPALRQEARLGLLHIDVRL